MLMSLRRSCCSISRFARRYCKDTILISWYARECSVAQKTCRILHLVFHEFYAKPYRTGDYESSHNKFDEYFGKLKTPVRMDPDMVKLDNFLLDVCHSVCLMYEEG